MTGIELAKTTHIISLASHRIHIKTYTIHKKKTRMLHINHISATVPPAREACGSSHLSRGKHGHHKMGNWSEMGLEILDTSRIVCLGVRVRLLNIRHRARGMRHEVECFWGPALS